MRTKISKVARDLNVGVSTAVEFLRKHNIEVDEGPNARIDSDAVDMLTKEFSSDKNTKADAEKVFNATFDLFKDELSKGEKVSVAGFGVFKISERAARDGRNPQTGETIKIAASKSVSFKAGTALKEEVNK